MRLSKKNRLLFSLAILLILSLYNVGISRFQKDIPAVTPTPTKQKTSVQGIQHPTPSPEPTKEGTIVLRIVDGDTIVLEGDQKLRYIGINTPESVDPRRPVECMAKEASNRNKELVEGKQVTLEKDVSETDRYGRLLRYVYVDGVMVNEQLVREGYALASAYPPDVKYQDRLKAAEDEARMEKRGLWGKCPKK